MTNRKLTFNQQLRLKPLVAALTLFAITPLAHAASLTSWLSTETAAMTVGLDDAVSRGELKSGEPMHVVLSLKLRDRSGLESFLSERMRPGSPAFGQSMTPAQFQATYAPTDAQTKLVSAYLTRMGFVNVVVDANKQLVSAEGTAGTVAAAFNTRIEGFGLSDRIAYANTLPAMIPAELSGSVQAVLGLQNVIQAHTALQQASVSGNVIGSKAAVATGHNPLEFPALYGVGSTPNAIKTSVGILSSGNIAQSITDLRTFESQNSLPATPVTQVQIGAAGTDTSGVPEWDLDSQDIEGMSGGVKSLVFYVIPTLSNSDLTAGFNKVVADGNVKIINVSLGECETGARLDGSMSADDSLFAQAVAQGQTFTVSTGDSGSAECGRIRKGQSYPAVSPYVVAIGGTTLYTASGAYSSESTWSGGGGGPSNYEAKPSWQSGVGSASARSVPDYSLDADPNSGAKIVVSGKAAQYGGTSLSAPLFAAVWARMQSNSSTPLPFPNPTLYASATSKGLFNDVTSGSNGDYSATAGWDYATGWGSPKIYTIYHTLTGG
jgi:pseudomonalisin